MVSGGLGSGETQVTLGRALEKYFFLKSGGTFNGKRVSIKEMDPKDPSELHLYLKSSVKVSVGEGYRRVFRSWPLVFRT